MDLRFVYDGWNLVQEIDGLVEVESGVTDVTREYTWGLDLSGQSGNPSPVGIHGAGGIGGLLGTHWTLNTTSTSDDKAYIYFYDANGNVGQMIDVVSGTNYGTIAAKYEYYPFGGLLVADGVAAEANPFRFSTKYRDNETGCYYYGYRYLRTKHGRWLNRDPIGAKGGLLSHGFVANNSVNLWDLLGTHPHPLPKRGAWNQMKVSFRDCEGWPQATLDSLAKAARTGCERAGVAYTCLQRFSQLPRPVNNGYEQVYFDLIKANLSRIQQILRDVQNHACLDTTIECECNCDPDVIAYTRGCTYGFLANIHVCLAMQSQTEAANEKTILHEMTHYGCSTDDVGADPINAHVLQNLIPWLAEYCRSHFEH